jgi:hypothetical protein
MQNFPTKEEVQAFIKGHERANEAVQQERIAWLSNLSHRESEKLYQDLCALKVLENLEDSYGDLENFRIQQKLAVRNRMNQVSGLKP